jgi:hypothetical protein
LKEDARGPEHQQLRKTAGLCADCLHARTIRADRGSVFFLCQRSALDPRYARYPRLPVLACRGYERREEQ